MGELGAFGFMKFGPSSDPANLIREPSLRCSVHRDWDVDEHVVPILYPPPWNLGRDPSTFLSRRGTDQRL